MPLPSQPLPTIGNDNATEDSKIRASLLELQTIISALDGSNLAAGVALELLVGGTRRKVAFGAVGNIDFGATSFASITIAHGLGAVPIFVLVTNGHAVEVNTDARAPYIAAAGLFTSTTFLARFRTANSAVIGSASIDPASQWLAIA